MSDAPERIWLQRTEGEGYRDGWTWCWHRIDDDPDLPDAEYVHADIVEGLVEALTSIARNTCCDGCGEAARWARASLAAYREAVPEEADDE